MGATEEREGKIIRLIKAGNYVKLRLTRQWVLQVLGFRPGLAALFPETDESGKVSRVRIQWFESDAEVEEALGVLSRRREVEPGEAIVSRVAIERRPNSDRFVVYINPNKVNIGDSRTALLRVTGDREMVLKFLPEGEGEESGARVVKVGRSRGQIVIKVPRDLVEGRPVGAKITKEPNGLRVEWVF